MKTILFDIDGTLVDSNDMHAEAWDIVFREAGLTIDRAVIRGQIGKGGDQLVPTLVPDLGEEAQDALNDRHGAIFRERFIDRVRPFPDAHAIIAAVVDRGGKAVLASSASGAELDHYVDLLDARALLAATTNSDEVETSKPAGDIFAAALDKLGIDADEAIVVGDTPYDMEAAGKCGIAAVAVRSGGFDDDGLRKAGAIAIYDDVAALLAGLDASPLA